MPWILALIGLAVPLVAGGGAGWPYVVGWLLVLVLLAGLQPIREAGRPDRIRWTLVGTVLLVVPGFLVGGIYLVPAAIALLLLEMVDQRANSVIP